MKIKLKPECSERVEQWASELNRRTDEVNATLHAEGVELEAAFLDRQEDGDYLIYIMSAPDFEHAQAVAHQSESSVDAFHRAFKQECWDVRTPLRSLIDFSAKIGSHEPS